MTRTLSRLFVFPHGPSRILPRTNFATKRAHLCSSVRASSSSNENDDIHRIFRSKFISDDADAQLFECAKTFSARDFTDIISEYNPDILGRKKKNQAKLGKGISGRALSSFNIVLSAFLENERYAEIERVFSIWQEEFERLEPDLVSVSLVVTALHRTHDIANVERFISEQKSRLIKRPNKKVSKKKINVNKYERDNVLPMDIVFEDNDIIAVNKTSGVPSTSDPAMPSVSEFVMAMKKDDSSFSLSEMNGTDARGLSAAVARRVPPQACDGRGPEWRARGAAPRDRGGGNGVATRAARGARFSWGLVARHSAPNTSPGWSRDEQPLKRTRQS